MRNGPFLIKNEAFLMRNGVFLTKNGSFLAKNRMFLIRDRSFLTKNGSFLIRNTVFQTLKRVFLAVSKPFLGKKDRKGEKTMASSGNWLPGDREGQLNMAKVWYSVVQSRGGTWGIPPQTMTDLQTAANDAEIVLQTAQSSDRTPAITTECQRLFGELVAKMRFIKDRYFKTPPLVDEDYTALLLKVPDTTRSPRGTPKAQMTAEIGRSGTAMLILHYKYAEGTESLADPHTDIRYQVRYGVLPPPGIPPAGKDLTKVPTEPEELPIVFSTKRKKDIINFDPADSGKTAYFDIRIENGVDAYGPWCPIFHAIVP
jgi:hypothetical protein